MAVKAVSRKGCEGSGETKHCFTFGMTLRAAIIRPLLYLTHCCLLDRSGTRNYWQKLESVESWEQETIDTQKEWSLGNKKLLAETRKCGVLGTRNYWQKEWSLGNKKLLTERVESWEQETIDTQKEWSLGNKKLLTERVESWEQETIDTQKEWSLGNKKLLTERVESWELLTPRKSGVLGPKHRNYWHPERVESWEQETIDTQKQWSLEPKHRNYWHPERVESWEQETIDRKSGVLRTIDTQKVWSLGT